LANKAIRKYGMGSYPIHVAIESPKENAFIYEKAYSSEAVAIIQACESEATMILERNKLLLLKMAEYLTSHSRMEEALIGEYIQKYSTEEWVNQKGFVKKEDYYQFNKTIQQQLKEMDEQDVDNILDDLINPALAICTE
jgi:hypothetical protein